MGGQQEGADILIAWRQQRLKITAIIPAEIQEETNIRFGKKGIFDLELTCGNKKGVEMQLFNDGSTNIGQFSMWK